MPFKHQLACLSFEPTLATHPAERQKGRKVNGLYRCFDSAGTMARFASITELEAFLRSLDREYGQYSLPLWQNGVRRPEQIANADKQDLMTAGVPLALYATDIIVRAGRPGQLAHVPFSGVT